jgi:uracil-DNA glycosylase
MKDTTIPIPGLTECTRCPRLVACREKAAEKPVRGFTAADYWSRPVPGFGDPDARLVILGLAPGAHGANRSGRPFTGDAAGTWLYPTLHKFGFANRPDSVTLGDGLVLEDAYITNVVKCVPPGNQPTPLEAQNCAPYLDMEMARLKRANIFMTMGGISWRSYLLWAKERGFVGRMADFPFAHGAEYRLDNEHTVLASYHCSRLNTNTGKLTRPMFEDVFRRARALIDALTR